MKIIFLLFISLVSFSSIAENKPNIIFFFADDLGFGDLKCYGHPYAKTPNLDKLASEGTRFTQHYVTGVTCNPSRTGLMTGKFPARYKKYAAFFGFGKERSITELLKENGYATGHFGKWHIGPKSSETNGTYGIDKVMTIGSSADKSAGRDDDLTTAAIEFIKENAKKPFYVNIWGHSTHFPVSAAPKHAAQFVELKVDRTDFSPTMQHKFDECIKIGGNLDKSMHQYLGDVYSLDANVGRVMKVIDELGIRDNTILIFSSDHGPAPVILSSKKIREHSKNMLGYAGKYKGGKHTQFEGGLRVPFIIRWPGKVKAGRVDEESVCSFIDYLPTLAKITGIKELPSNLDGEDISDIWFGESRDRVKPLFWKASSKAAAPSMREGKWKLHLGKKGEVELHDLSVDPAESKNIAADYPKVAESMTEKLKAWLSELPEDYEKLEKKNKGNKKQASKLKNK